MSSIHDALRRAERERENRLMATAASILSGGSRRGSRIRTRTVAGGAALLICLALVIYSWLDSETLQDGEIESHGPAVEALSTQEITLEEPVLSAPASNGSDESLKLFRMGRVMHQSGKLNEAGALYRDALRLNPEMVEAGNNLGVVLLSLGDYIAAEKEFLDVQGLRPDYVDAQYNLACVYTLSGRIDEALTALSRAVAMYPGVREWAFMDKDLASLRDVPGFDRAVLTENR